MVSMVGFHHPQTIINFWTAFYIHRIQCMVYDIYLHLPYKFNHPCRYIYKSSHGSVIGYLHRFACENPWKTHLKKQTTRWFKVTNHHPLVSRSLNPLKWSRELTIPKKGHDLNHQTTRDFFSENPRLFGPVMLPTSTMHLKQKIRNNPPRLMVNPFILQGVLSSKF